MTKRLFLPFLMAVMLALVPPAAAQDSTLVAAEVVNDEGGTIRVTGQLNITNSNVLFYTVQPLIILEDQGGFVERNIDFEFPLESQVQAQLTSDFYSGEPVTFNLNLPIEPQGTQHDLDNDGEEDAGVQVYQIAHWDNRFGGPFLEPREGYAWSGAYSSATTSNNPETLYEINGGSLLIWSPDDAQGFPSGFGEDGLLFTEDDPAVLVPQGYTLVSLDSDPFTFDRSREPFVILQEPEDFVQDDFSALSYTDAFDALIDKGRREYAFTDLKNIDWDALSTEFRPRIEQAEVDGDYEAYALALYEMARSIPDGHVSAISDVSEAVENERIAGGLGIAVRELDDGRVLVNFVLEGSPAAEAGIEYGAEIIDFNGILISEAISAVDSVNGPYSLDVTERLDQVRFVTRFPLDTKVEVTFANPGKTEETVSLNSVEERDSLRFSRQFVYGAPTGQFIAPVEWSILPEGIGYIKVNDFYGNEPLMIESWEYFFDLVNQIGVTDVIIDLRTNGGGFTFIANRLASYLFDEEFELSYSEGYNKDIDAFFSDPRFPAMIQPEPSLYYGGDVAVLVGPGCASACEFFAYALSARGRSEVVGQYPTNGIAGGTEDIPMPEGITFRLPTNRDRDTEGNIIIEGIGIPPTVDVPVNEENMAETEIDVVLQAAIELLSQ